MLKGNYTIKVGSLPKFYRWEAGRNSDWSFGWLTGKDNDLICIKPHILTDQAEPTLSIILSPICSNRFLALCAFIMKVSLVRIDPNLSGILIGGDEWKIKRNQMNTEGLG